MRLLLLLLLCAQSVISSLTSNLRPDLWNRNAGVIYYTVIPVDPTQAVETTRTEAALKDLCGEAKVTPIRSDGDESGTVVESWNVSSMDGIDLTATIEAINGVSSVEYNDPSHPSATSSDRFALAPREDVKTYGAVTNETNVQEIEDFLNSKIESGTKLYRYELDGQFLGWYNLVLTSEAAEAVKGHKGIKGVMEEEALVQFRALPNLDGLQPSPKTSHMFDERLKLAARAGSWEKQASADKALVMDSQFS
jgi:hypothetical protein